MALRIRRGTDAQRSGVTFNSGEIVWTTDQQKLWVGDGITQGGIPAVGPNITGYGLSYDVQTHKIEVAGLSADDITNGTNNKFFSSTLVQDAVGPMFTTGSHTGISFQYDSNDGVINATVALDGVGITAVVDDTSPQLGGDLDLNTNDITGIGTINITGSVTGTTVTGTSFVSGHLSIANDALLTTKAAPFPSIPGLDSDFVLASGSNTNPQTLWQYATKTFNIHNGIIGTLDGATSIQTRMSRGTLSIPQVITGNDRLLKIVAQGYDGVGFTTAGAFGIQVDTTDAVSEGFIPGSFGVITIGSSGPQQLTFNSRGLLTVPTISVGDGTAGAPSIKFGTDASVDTGFFHPGDGIVCVSTNGVEKARFDGGGLRVTGFMKVADVAGSLPSPAEAGMIVLDGSTFKGYNGTSWVTLG